MFINGSLKNLNSSNIDDLSEIIFSKGSSFLSKPALFLDRDGVLIKDCHYISKEEQVILEQFAGELVRYAFESDWLVVVVSNQSGISRGIFTWDDYYKITKRMLSLFGNPNPFHAIYANSQGPHSILRNWRKPSPEMIIRASKVLNIDINKSIIVGDRLTDIIAGIDSGIKILVHTRTGHGIKENKKLNDFIKQNSTRKDLKFIKIKNLSQFPLKYFSKLY
tara:strand:+ start:8029 stop:8691 length:663 start_codon:yes stop_codon:yes gene_type:complete